jgi:hypothetical protein
VRASTPQHWTRQFLRDRSVFVKPMFPRFPARNVPELSPHLSVCIAKPTDVFPRERASAVEGCPGTEDWPNYALPADRRMPTVIPYGGHVRGRSLGSKDTPITPDECLHFKFCYESRKSLSRQLGLLWACQRRKSEIVTVKRPIPLTTNLTQSLNDVCAGRTGSRSPSENCVLKGAFGTDYRIAKTASQSSPH